MQSINRINMRGQVTGGDNFIKRIETLGSDHNSRRDIIKKMSTSKQGKINICEIPNEDNSLDSDILIIGLTPGYSQLEKLINIFRQHSKNQGDKFTERQNIATISQGEALSKIYFAGQMRKNLFDMLAKIGITNISTRNPCWTAEYHQVPHKYRMKVGYTSLLRAAVFNNYKNYTGYSPRINNIPILQNERDKTIANLHKLGEQMTLIIPLGRIVEQEIKGNLDLNSYHNLKLLQGFSHPSSANGHRIRQFNQNKKVMAHIVDLFVKAKYQSD